MQKSRVPPSVLELIQDFLTFRGDTSSRAVEVDILKLLVTYTTKDLEEGTCPNPMLATENLKWFKVRLGELGVKEV